MEEKLVMMGDGGRGPSCYCRVDVLVASDKLFWSMKKKRLKQVVEGEVGARRFATARREVWSLELGRCE
jgi:hypothetical protein